MGELILKSPGKKLTLDELADAHRRKIFAGEMPQTFIDTMWLCDCPYEPGHTCPEAEKPTNALPEND